MKWKYSCDIITLWPGPLHKIFVPNWKYHPLASQHQGPSIHFCCLKDLGFHPSCHTFDGQYKFAPDSTGSHDLVFFLSWAPKLSLSPLSLHVFPPSPLSFISIGEHRLARLSPSVWTNISLHAALIHSSIHPPFVLYSSPSTISPALPPSKYLTGGETIWIQLDGWRCWLEQALIMQTGHLDFTNTRLNHSFPLEGNLIIDF